MLERDIIAVCKVNLLFSQHPSKSGTSTEYRSWQNYLRNSTASIGQYLLKHSSLIAIENKMTSKLDLSEVINKFAVIKAHKRLLTINVYF